MGYLLDDIVCVLGVLFIGTELITDLLATLLVVYPESEKVCPLT